MYIKRGDKIHGPFTERQLRGALKSRKLRKTDLFCKSNVGPWRPVQVFFRKKPQLVIESKSNEEMAQKLVDNILSVMAKKAQKKRRIFIAAYACLMIFMFGFLFALVMAMKGVYS